MPDSTRTDNKRKIDKLFDSCFNHHDLAVLDELVSPDYVGPQGDKGPAAFRAVVGGLHAAFPDIHYTIDEVVGEEDRVGFVGTGQERTAARSEEFPPRAKRCRRPAPASFGSAKARSCCRPADRSSRILAANRCHS